MDIHKTMSNLAVPNQLNYAQGVVPIAIESRSQKRTFTPVNGVVFGPTSNNVIRFNINSDNLWDISHSYFMSVDAALRYHSFRILIVYLLLHKSEFLLC